MKKSVHNPARRQLLAKLGGVVLGSSALYATSARFQLVNAQMPEVEDYKALVCIFLFGGNDAFNMLVPAGESEYAAYAASRQTLAIPHAELLSITPQQSPGLALGLHPSMSGVQSLFAQQKLAVVANVGALIEPVSKAAYQSNSVQLPPQLFSHNDQQTFMQSLQSGSRRTGWAGRAADVLDSVNTNQQLSMNISMSGSNIWQNGARVVPYSIDPSGIKKLANLNANSDEARERARTQIYHNLLAQQQENIFQRQFAHTQTLAWELAGEVKGALDAQAPIVTAFPASQVGNGLKMVAQMISARAALGVKRQIFFVGMGDFDTHGDQLRRHVLLLNQLSSAMQAFYSATVELGVAEQVTTFTSSDFGRTLTSNGDGTDHGWGSHQLVMGGAVNGGNIYGTLPSLSVGGVDDIGQGRIIPSIGMDQYAATLASWYGLPGNQFGDVFPNLGNFNQLDLGLFS